MTFGFLLDEHMPVALALLLEKRDQDLIVERVGRGNAPAKASSDGDLLEYSDRHGLCLVTKDSASMIGHLLERVQAGNRSTGIALFTREVSLMAMADDLLLMRLALSDEDLIDQVVYLPY